VPEEPDAAVGPAEWPIARPCGHRSSTKRVEPTTIHGGDRFIARKPARIQCLAGHQAFDGTPSQGSGIEGSDGIGSKVMVVGLGY